MRFSVLAVAAGTLAMPLAARADLTGDTIQVTYNYPDAGTQFGAPAYIVAPGTGNFAGEANYTVTGNQIILTSFIDTTVIPSLFSGFEFEDVSKNPMITGISVDPASTLPVADVDFNSTTAFINLSGQTIASGEVAIFDLTFAPPVTPVPVAATPEPSSLALLGTGALGVAGVLRRRFLQA